MGAGIDAKISDYMDTDGVKSTWAYAWSICHRPSSAGPGCVSAGRTMARGDSPMAGQSGRMDEQVAGRERWHLLLLSRDLELAVSDKSIFKPTQLTKGKDDA
jgi:hypothetical protein